MYYVLYLLARLGTERAVKSVLQPGRIGKLRWVFPCEAGRAGSANSTFLQAKGRLYPASKGIRALIVR